MGGATRARGNTLNKTVPTQSDASHNFSFEGMEKKEDTCSSKKAPAERRAELFVEILF